MGRVAELGSLEPLRGSDDEVRSKSVWPFMVFRHVAQVRDIRPVVGEHGGGEGFDFGEAYGLPPKRFPRHAGCLNAGAHRQVAQPRTRRWMERREASIVKRELEGGVHQLMRSIYQSPPSFSILTVSSE